MSRGRLAAHLRRRRGLWIAGGVLAVLLVPYVTAFYTLRRSKTEVHFAMSAAGDGCVVSHRWHWFAGSPATLRALHFAFTPLHRWILGGLTTDELYGLSYQERRSLKDGIYSAEPLDRWMDL